MLSRRTFLKTVGVATVALAVGRLPDHFIGSALRAIALEATPIEDLGLQVRLANALKACDISTIGQLLSKRQDELLRLRSVGRFCLGHTRPFYSLPRPINNPVCRNSEFRNWSGARDLNPGPHGPEPSWLHVL